MVGFNWARHADHGWLIGDGEALDTSRYVVVVPTVRRLPAT